MDNKNMIKVLGQMVRRDALLAALHNNTRPLGFGVLHALNGDLSVVEAARALNNGPLCVDYLFGRPIKCMEMEDGTLDDRSQYLYERDAGPGAFAKAAEQAAEMTRELEAR